MEVGNVFFRLEQVFRQDLSMRVGCLSGMQLTSPPEVKIYVAVWEEC